MRGGPHNSDLALAVARGVGAPLPPPIPRQYGLLDAMLELARRAPAKPAGERTEVDGARHAMIGIFAGMMTGGLTRYAFPPPRFELVDGKFEDRTYQTETVETSGR